MTRRSQHRLRHGDGWIETRATAAGEPRYLARWTVRQPDGTFTKRSKQFRSEAEAEHHLHEVADRGWRIDGADDPLTVRAIIDDWLTRGSTRWKSATQLHYRRHARLHVLPVFGDLDPRDLTTPMVQRWIDELVRRGLAPSTIQAVTHVLGSACKEAVRLGLLAANPVANTRRPSVRQPPIAVWTARDVQTIIAALADEPMWEAVYRLALTTGMRPGELVALRWQDLDLARGIATVSRTATRDTAGREIIGDSTKTGRPRSVTLTPLTVASLRRWQTAQKAVRLAAPRWDDQGFAFTGPDGRFCSVEVWRYRHRALIAATGVTAITLHGLRHTHATAELDAGTHPLIVSTRLGHLHVEMTLNRYQHVSDALHRAAAEALEDRLFGDDAATTSAP